MPLPTHRMLARLPQAAKRRLYRGDARFCPVCESQLAYFLPAGLVRRDNARCPVCGSMERHRLMWLYFQERTDLLDGRPKRMLHLAPEKCIAPKLRRQSTLTYVSSDLQAPDVMVWMDMTRACFADGQFDVIYASHILEHIPDDHQAMCEIARLLRPDGWAILQVPLEPERATTYEDFSIVEPAARERAFGQRDHVRVYGRDYAARLEAAGLRVTVDSFVRELPLEEIQRLGLLPNEDIYCCTRA